MNLRRVGGEAGQNTAQPRPTYQEPDLVTTYPPEPDAGEIHRKRHRRKIHEERTMSDRNTVVRSMHDLGLSAWFGGSLMGAVGLNGATARAADPAERLKLSSLGWKFWAPVNAGAIAVHGIGGLGLILANRRRVEQQEGAGANTAVKTVLTLVAAGLTAYSGALGRKVESQSQQGGEGATEPRPEASDDLASAQRQLKLTQWAIPALTSVLVVLAAQQGEQQRPGQQLGSRLASV